MASESDEARWTSEFEALGLAKVRSEVMLGRLPPDKRAYARLWLERQDVQEWQARAPAGGGGLAKLRINKKLWGLITGLIFGGFALFRILRQFKIGF